MKRFDKKHSATRKLAGVFYEQKQVKNKIVKKINTNLKKKQMDLKGVGLNFKTALYFSYPSKSDSDVILGYGRPLLCEQGSMNFGPQVVHISKMNLKVKKKRNFLFF